MIRNIANGLFYMFFPHHQIQAQGDKWKKQKQKKKKYRSQMECLRKGTGL